MRIDKKREVPWRIMYPGLEVIDLSDPEIQKDLILKGVAVGVPGGEILFTHNVVLEAGGAKL